eukprot:TRINITY_DN21572_c0_g1_i1.p1 TRINITY_DN21572_c0_g1~~TRINITY_DN21572_c0_g1_i1.p1  ORF type:complete len:103 (-),score=1.08 TRINITY_DN21572_c0_g1_i1:146-424(-)
MTDGRGGGRCSWAASRRDCEVAFLDEVMHLQRLKQQGLGARRHLRRGERELLSAAAVACAAGAARGTKPWNDSIVTGSREPYSPGMLVSSRV